MKLKPVPLQTFMVVFQSSYYVIVADANVDRKLKLKLSYKDSTRDGPNAGRRETVTTNRVHSTMCRLVSSRFLPFEA